MIIIAQRTRIKMVEVRFVQDQLNSAHKAFLIFLFAHPLQMSAMKFLWMHFCDTNAVSLKCKNTGVRYSDRSIWPPPIVCRWQWQWLNCLLSGSYNPHSSCCYIPFTAEKCLLLSGQDLWSTRGSLGRTQNGAKWVLLRRWWYILDEKACIHGQPFCFLS